MMEIAVNALSHLADDGYVDADEPALNVRAEKVVAETGLLVFAASTAQVNKVGLNALASALIPKARSERMLLGLCTQPSLALDYAFAHVCLTRAGFPDERFDKVLRRAACAQAFHGRERPPHRVLEREWTASGVWPERRNVAPSVIRDSALGRPSDLLAGTKEDYYALTHALMYGSDFGQHGWKMPRRRQAIAEEAETMLSWALDVDDFDLAGELLLTWPLLGLKWSPVALFAFRVLAAAEDEAGYLPSTGTDLERAKTLEGAARKRYLLATAYHTAYVMGLLCAAALHPSAAPSSQSGRRQETCRPSPPTGDGNGHCFQKATLALTFPGHTARGTERADRSSDELCIAASSDRQRLCTRPRSASEGAWSRARRRPGRESIRRVARSLAAAREGRQSECA